MDLIAHIRHFIREHDLIRPGTRVATAVSGGSDSIALLHLLAELDGTGALTLAGVIHFNHQLRAEAADADEAFVRATASALGVPFVADRGDVRARAQREHRSVETAARAARHEWFERARDLLTADCVALGHTRDDQAETFLLRLMRGAGPRGLSGMHPRNGIVVRPLLGCRRAELRAWLDARGAGHVEDATNEDVAIPRNRVRAELIPMMAERFNPGVVDILADQAALSRELWDWMGDASAPFLLTPGVLDLSALRAAPAALRRLVVWRAMSDASGGRHISFDHVAAVIRLITADHDAGLDLPGHSVQRNGSRLVLTRERGSRGSRGSWGSRGSRGSGANSFERVLAIPGTAEIPEAGCVVSADEAPVAERATVGSKAVAIIRRDLVRESLVVRNRRPGDKFRPVGLCGSKKLQDLFVDAKVPRDMRDAVPVVVDDRDRIVWVAGFGIDEAFRVTDSSQAVLVLRLTRS